MKSSATTEGEPRLVDDVKAAFKQCVELREENATLRTRLQQVEEERDAKDEVLKMAAWNIEHAQEQTHDAAMKLGETRAALQQAEAERDSELERKLQAQEDAADAIKRANELADEVNTQIQRAHGFKMEREEWQVALQAAERKITRLEERRVGIKRPV